MDEGERARRVAQRQSTFQLSALVVLVGRAGGSVTFTKSEHDAVAARYGGTANMSLHMDVIQTEGEEAQVRLTLLRKKPANGELVS